MGQKLRQTQLRLIVDNISLPVSTSRNIYTAISDAWTSAMQTLESLINGAPQRIDNGAVLLGLSAWHLYPDILLAGTNQLITQSDPLISSGGIITVGLRNKHEDSKGVVWSLPLTQARYYGEPVVATRHAGVEESNVLFEESMLVVVGSVVGSWQLPFETDDALDLIRIIANSVQWHDSSFETHTTNHGKPTNPLRSMHGQDWVEWISLLGRSVDFYIEALGTDKQNLMRLIKYGQRNCSKLLSSRKYFPAPVFGLTGFSQLLSPFDPGSEPQIELLRKWATRELDPHLIKNALIRYRKSPYGRFYYTNVVGRFEAKRRRTMNPSSKVPRDVPVFHWSDDEDQYEYQYEDTLLSLFVEQQIGALSLPPPSTEEGDTVDLPPGPGCKPEPHTFLCGIRESAAVYIRSNTGIKLPVKNNQMSVMQLYRCIKELDISPRHIALAFNDVGKSTLSSKTITYFESLCAIGAAAKIYEKLPGAQVNLQAMSLRVSKAKWWQSMQATSADRLQTVMSCIAYFETGAHDVDPKNLGEHTFAVCHATSIFVASRLLDDPIDDTLQYSVERIVGNVGKPGLSFLITPPDSKSRKFNASSWRLVNHEKYDGKMQDSFHGTSFHLSFTGYELPLDVGQRSGRDIPAYLLETAISVYDKGEWVTDLDILKASKHWSKAPKISCLHTPGDRHPPPYLSLISVDSWIEILDPPPDGQHAVVRASGNPIARLATASLALQKSRKVLILPPNVCWDCQGLSFVSVQNASMDLQLEDTPFPEPSFQVNDDPKLYGGSGSEGECGDREIDQWSDISESDGPGDRMVCGKNNDPTELGVFLIY